MDRHCCDISLKGAAVPAGAMMRRWAPQTRYTLRRNTASIMKDLIGFDEKTITLLLSFRLLHYNDENFNDKEYGLLNFSILFKLSKLCNSHPKLLRNIAS